MLGAQIFQVYLVVGEPEKAVSRLESILKRPGAVTPDYLRINPVFESLRGNPHFDRLVNTSCSGSAAGDASTVPVLLLGASNSDAGSGGPLVPGAATFVLELFQGTTVLDSREVAITLTAP